MARGSKFGFRKKRDCSIYIDTVYIETLIFPIVFAYAKSRFSHDVGQIECNIKVLKFLIDRYWQSVQTKIRLLFFGYSYRANIPRENHFICCNFRVLKEESNMIFHPLNM